MTLNILFITGSQGWSGGTERACADLANTLVSGGGYNVSILSAANGRQSFFEITPEIKLDEIYSTHRSLQVHAVDFIFKMRAFIKKNHPDIIIIVESFLTAFVVPATLGLRIQLVNWEHFGAQISLGTPLRRLARHMAARYCSHIVVLTFADRDLWQKKYHLSKSKISVIPNINPMHGRRQVDASQTDRRVVIAVGRLDEEKGFDLLLDAWSAIDRDVRKHWQLRIVGEGTLRVNLTAMARRLGIADEVELAGRSSNIQAEYCSASIFVQSSRFEGFGLVLVEAMTFGLPVIAFDCPTGPREIVEHGTTGILVEHLNVKALAEELERMMKSPQMRLDIGKRGRLAVERYAPKEILGKWNSVFEKIYNAYRISCPIPQDEI